MRDKVTPSALSDDSEFVRRIHLDLVGRIPTKDEVQHFLADRDPQKRSKLIDQLLASGEFAKHWRENLNSHFMGSPAFSGDGEWRKWLEDSLKQNKKWDVMAREILAANSPGASQFLLSRFAQGDSGLDTATRDVSRYFFGVDIQCSRCHKHPEVEQWKQEYYWGMAAYFNRSYLLPVKGKNFLAERSRGEVEYTTKAKKVTTIGPMFLTGEKVNEPPLPPKPAAKPNADKAKPVVAAAPAMPMDDPAEYLVPPETEKEKTRVPVPKFSRRMKLIEMAVNGKNPYFKRAAVNYVWQQLLGRGLVEPIDQMHEGNPPSHPELLDFLADDFVAHQFDLRHVIRVIANSRVYQLSSRSPASSSRPAEQTFAVAAIRPMTMHQLGMSLLVATGYQDELKAKADAATRADAGLLRAKMESQYAGTLQTLVKNLDTGETFQPGVREALFEANGPAFAEFVAKGGLAKRLAGIKDDGALIQQAFVSVLSRSPSPEEAARLQDYLKMRGNRRAAACEQIVWALVTSSEFRFIH